MSCSNPVDVLKAKIAQKGSMVVAFSGGVDSSLLSLVAKETLGNQHLCILLDSPLLPAKSREQAEIIAHKYGLNFEILPFKVLEQPGIDSNPSDRCYHCKKASAKLLKSYASMNGFNCVADGTNLSDLGEYRPGLAAGEEEGIIYPFVEAGINKSDIREIANERGYIFWNFPSSACLASRIPYNENLTEDKLKTIDEAENILSSLGFIQVRVRLHGDGAIARIEILEEELESFLTYRKKVVSRLKNLGVLYVTIDIEGYRSGSMDEIL
ncbi:MAG: ATP-dependent sacrificial sulfur transferase LarE [Methanohalobium sp.]|uniref:ATP-dependent sacrificial sulfur transferase LarE n=1 Tax=Methanohalobium sp. TaxID=2837493 RepID=UPI00397DAF4B